MFKCLILLVQSISHYLCLSNYLVWIKWFALFTAVEVFGLMIFFFSLRQTAFPEHLYIIIRRPTPTLDFKYKAVTELIANISISSSDGAAHSNKPTGSHSVNFE